MSIPFEKPLAITRSGFGSYGSNGIWNAGASIPVVVMATVLPEKNLDVIAQLGGTNLTGIVTVRSVSELIPATETGVVGDRFSFDGQQYEIVAVSHYRDVIPHYKAWAKLMDGNEP